MDLQFWGWLACLALLVHSVFRPCCLGLGECILRAVYRARVKDLLERAMKSWLSLHFERQPQRDVMAQLMIHAEVHHANATVLISCWIFGQDNLR